jgi:hypothetical protein
MVFNAIFNNILVISWPSVLLVEEPRVPIENHRPATIQTNYNVVTSAPHHEYDRAEKLLSKC